MEFHGHDFSQIEGTGSNGIMVIGEASGKEEARECLPFRPYAPSGGVLERAFRRMSLKRNQFSITNCGRCRPRKDWLSDSPWEYAALRHCRPNLIAAIAEFRPRVIWTLGNLAMREVTGYSGVAREMQSISHLTGYCLPTAPDLSPVPIPVVPAFHTAYLRRGKMSHFGQLTRTLKRATNIAAGTDRDWLWGVVPEDPATHGGLRYEIHPSLDAAQAFAARVRDGIKSIVSYDIETQESASLDEDAREGFTDTRIQLVQFSIESGEGIAIPFDGAYRGIIGEILRGPNVKVGHNVWLFDNKVLRAAGEREGLDLIPRGTIHDTLAMFHHWQPDLPAHLQFAASFVSFPFPWKHLAATDLAFYGCCDADATLRLYTFLEAALRRDGIWDDGESAVA
jgi:uracil-DNA glycosylase family 4